MMDNHITDPMIDMKFIVNDSGFTDQYFYKKMRQQEFPRPIKFGRSSRWYLSEYNKWKSNREIESRKSQ
ncbi:helix-turn-helix transcriptional regulator [Providencia rettgeri]|uniref:helix-turn-helix transcriptional regulator n=1 Tax=Providencia rettgeri TaxID=587 RepID=UPI00137454D1|nr:AlpA family phage regulatory protein [Providencia rettgeri]BBU96555.1 hypothetical protein BML2496_24380 [Providencia rettgeri]